MGHSIGLGDKVWHWHVSLKVQLIFIQLFCVTIAYGWANNWQSLKSYKCILTKIWHKICENVVCRRNIDTVSCYVCTSLFLRFSTLPVWIIQNHLACLLHGTQCTKTNFCYGSQGLYRAGISWFVYLAWCQCYVCTRKSVISHFLFFLLEKILTTIYKSFSFQKLCYSSKRAERPENVK